MGIDWKNVRRVLVVRLRSIGDTVLATPSLIALKRFVPDAQVDILLEDWVAPVLDDFDSVDNVVTVGRTGSSRLTAARKIRRTGYDVVFNLHGGTTGTFFAYASGAAHRIGYSHYQYKFLYNHVLSSSADYWSRPVTHSAEQQLALLGFAGVPVEEGIKSRLVVTERAMSTLEEKFSAKAEKALNEIGKFALLHPAAAFDSKQWPIANFARTAEYLAAKGVKTIAVASRNETDLLDRLREESAASIAGFNDLALPEITALASRACLFVGNDSGIAHIAAAVGTPTVVIFGSSNVDHWRPWTDAPNEIVRDIIPCQPCAGYECKEFGDARCIRNVSVRAVTAAVERVTLKTKERQEVIPAAL